MSINVGTKAGCLGEGNTPEKVRCANREDDDARSEMRTKNKQTMYRIEA